MIFQGFHGFIPCIINLKVSLLFLNLKLMLKIYSLAQKNNFRLIMEENVHLSNLANSYQNLGFIKD